MKEKIARPSALILLMVCLPFLLFSFSDPVVETLEEQLKGASDPEKIRLMLEFSKKQSENLPEKSLEYTREALRLAEDLHTRALESGGKIANDQLLHMGYRTLYLLYKKTGDIENALEYYKNYNEIGDKIINEKSLREITGMQARYEAQQNENELRLLRKTARSQRMSGIFLVTVVLLSLGVMVMLYSRFRAKKRDGELLRAGEAKYRALFSLAGDTIFLVDGPIIVDCNQKRLDVFGYTRDQLIGRSFSHISPPTQPDNRHSLEKGMQLIEKALTQGPRQFYWKHIKKDGTAFDTITHLTPVTVDDKKFIQVVIHDISHRKELEDERVKAAKLETVNLLAGGIAHDFNNLLAVMMGNLGMARMSTEPGSKTVSLISRMQIAANSAADLSQKFLSISDGEFYTWETIAVGPILRQTVRQITVKRGDAAVNAANVQCPVDIAPGLWEVRCDVKQIRRVIFHVIHNAVEAVETAARTGDGAGGGQIWMGAVNLELTARGVPPLDPGKYVLITVKDNGGGIRGNRGNRGVECKGMGLTIALSIVKRHNGSIYALSEPGAGSTFHIYLPAVSTAGVENVEDQK